MLNFQFWPTGLAAQIENRISKTRIGYLRNRLSPYRAELERLCELRFDLRAL
jgi:hypothetical protein